MLQHWKYIELYFQKEATSVSKFANFLYRSHFWLHIVKLANCCRKCSWWCYYLYFWDTELWFIIIWPFVDSWQHKVCVCTCMCVGNSGIFHLLPFPLNVATFQASSWRGSTFLSAPSVCFSVLYFSAGYNHAALSLENGWRMRLEDNGGMSWRDVSSSVPLAIKALLKTPCVATPHTSPSAGLC